MELGVGITGFVAAERVGATAASTAAALQAFTGALCWVEHEAWRTSWDTGIRARAPVGCGGLLAFATPGPAGTPTRALAVHAALAARDALAAARPLPFRAGRRAAASTADIPSRACAATAAAAVRPAFPAGTVGPTRFTTGAIHAGRASAAWMVTAPAVLRVAPRIDARAAALDRVPPARLLALLALLALPGHGIHGRGLGGGSAQGKCTSQPAQATARANTGAGAGEVVESGIVHSTFSSGQE